MLIPRLSLKACHKITVFLSVLLCRDRGCNIFPSAVLLAATPAAPTKGREGTSVQAVTAALLEGGFRKLTS